MDDISENIGKIVVESAECEKLSEHNNCHDNASVCENDNPVKADKTSIKLGILEKSANNANRIYELMNKQEEAKSKERKNFFIFFKLLLTVSLLFIARLIYLDAYDKIELSLQVVIALFTYVIANIFAVIVIMAKYITQNNYLETFKVVTHKLLDYLVDDKKNDIE